MAADPARRIEGNSPEAEAVYASAPDGLKVEIVGGMVCMAPAPIAQHQRLALRLGRRLTPFDRRDGGPADPRGWVFVPEPELHLGDRPDKMKPDLAGWREKRATFSMRATSITVAPDWVCEVLSASTEKFDRGTKALVYAEHEVEWLWLVDPEASTIEVFRNERHTFRPVHTLRDGDTGSLPPFEVVSLDHFFED